MAKIAKFDNKSERDEYIGSALYGEHLRDEVEGLVSSNLPIHYHNISVLGGLLNNMGLDEEYLLNCGVVKIQEDVAICFNNNRMDLKGKIMVRLEGSWVSKPTGSSYAQKAMKSWIDRASR